MVSALPTDQWCSKTTKLQGQVHLIFQDQDRFFKDHHIIKQRPEKTFLYRKNQASDVGFAQSCRN